MAKVTLLSHPWQKSRYCHIHGKSHVIVTSMAKVTLLSHPWKKSGCTIDLLVLPAFAENIVGCEVKRVLAVGLYLETIICCTKRISRQPSMTFHHVFIFSKCKFYAIYNGENHFKSEDVWPSYTFLNVVVRHSALLRKLALNVGDFFVKTIGWG